MAVKDTPELIKPVLSDWDDLKKTLVKECAPVYWQDELKEGCGVPARLIRVGVDIPAIWSIDDSEQNITADLYLTFT